MSAAGLDLEALLVALVLSPATYSRNRFFDLHKDPAVRRVRRRASLVRSIIGQLTSDNPLYRGELIGLRAVGAGRMELSYVVPAPGMRRTSTLDPIELSLIRFAFDRRGQGPMLRPLPPEDTDRIRIETALRRLVPASFQDEPASAEPH
jgi:hypothetical protein